MQNRMKKRLLAAMLLILCFGTAAVAGASDLVSDAMFERATAFAKGDLSRLESVMHRAQAGEGITIGVIGGSITQGTNISAPRYAYANLMLAWWMEQFPQAEFTLVNAGIGGTDSYLGVHRLQRDLLDAEPDLVIVEFSVNDGNTVFDKKSYENLVRRTLLAENMPAVVLLFMTQENGTSAQDQHANIGFRYGLPMISFRNAVLPEVEAGNMRWRELASDHIHPNDRGHAIVSELLTRYFWEVYEQLGEAAPVPLPFDRAPVERQSYQYARIENAETITPAVPEKAVVGDYFPNFPAGWRSTQGDSLVFTVTSANIGILYLRTASVASAAFEVYIDGELAATLDGDFSGGWGDYAAAQEVLSSKEIAEHLIEIRPIGDQMVTVLGLLIS